jgi:hypothetical protein
LLQLVFSYVVFNCNYFFAVCFPSLGEAETFKLALLRGMMYMVGTWRLWRNLKNLSRQPMLNKITKVEDKNRS